MVWVTDGGPALEPATSYGIISEQALSRILNTFAPRLDNTPTNTTGSSIPSAWIAPQGWSSCPTKRKPSANPNTTPETIPSPQRPVG
jgi:hypothetical protein